MGRDHRSQWYFGLVSLVAFVSVALLRRRESGPRGHGLETEAVSLALEHTGQ